MKISLLLKREDFYNIFITTIQDYFLKNNNKTLFVSKIFKKKSTKFIVNKHLNIIYPSTINRSYLIPLIREYSWNKNFYKRALQSLYLFISVRFPFQNLLSDKSILSLAAL